MTEKKDLLDQSNIPYNYQNYRMVEEGNKWRCIHCGSCCCSDFEEYWLDFISTFQNPRTMDGKCPNLKFEDDKYTCSIYSKHPNACRVFPFTLKKQADGNYKLVIHGKCKGYGKGRTINIRQKIQHCLGYSNREFHKKTRLDFESFDTDRSVVLVFRRD